MLATKIRESLAILERGLDSVRSVMGQEENRFTRALEDLQRLADGEGIPLALVGGLAAIRYGYPAATQDIDVAVSRQHLADLVRAAPRYGFRVAWEAATGLHTLTHGDVEINVVPEGAKARNTAPTTIPGPPALGVTKGLDYAALPGWMELKLSSARQKDKAQVVEVMKKTGPEALEAARQHVTAVHPSYRELFDELRRQALAEKAQEEER